MNKKIAAAVMVLAVFILASCTIQIVDRPDYYRDYDDAAAYNYNYNYTSTGYTAVQAAVPTVMPTPAPTQKAVINYITLKVVQNYYYFYEGDTEVANWRFNEDGTILKKGKVINGLVKRFYDGTNIVESEIPFKNGERWGACKKFYPNGLLKESINYQSGDRAGDFIVYYPNGRIMEEGGYKKGKRYGNYKKYHETGELVERGVFEKDKVRVIYAKATAVPTPVPAATQNQGNQGPDRQKYTHDDNPAGNNWRQNKPAETALPTRVPEVVITQVIIKERVEVPVVITVVVTATPQVVATAVVPAATAVNRDEPPKKPDWVEEKKEIKDAIKEDRKEIKEDVRELKDAIKDEAKDIRNDAKEIKSDVKEIIKDAKQEGKEIIRDAKGNTLKSVAPWKIQPGVSHSLKKTGVTATAESDDRGKEKDDDKHDDKGRDNAAGKDGHKGHGDEGDGRDSKFHDR